MNMNLEHPSAYVATLRHQQPGVGGFHTTCMSDSPEVDEIDNSVHQLDDGDLNDYSMINQKPKDRYNFVYLTLVMSGIGFLLPYNTYINVVDYYQVKYDNHLIVFDISLVYILIMLLSVCLTNFLVTKIHLVWRISFGYVITLFTLFSFLLFDIVLDVFPKKWSYSFTLVSAGIVSFGCTVQQSSFYGYTSMLPRRFTQAVMLGESAAGFIVSLVRLFTKGAVSNKVNSTTVFFLISGLLLLLCVVTFHIGFRSDYIRHCIAVAQEQRIHEAAGGSDYSRRGRLPPRHSLSTHIHLNTSSTGTEFGHENPAFTAEMQNIDQESDDDEGGHATKQAPQRVPSNEEEDIDLDSPGPAPTSFPSALPDILYTAGQQTSRKIQRVVGFEPDTSVSNEKGFQVRLHVAQQIWPFMLSICLSYLVTLSLFPGIETEIPSCRLKSWMPVLIMAVFNLADLMGKTVAAIPLKWSGYQILLCSVCRLILVPLLMTCATPRKSPVFHNDGWAYTVTAILGLTNGYFGSIPMIMAPQNVQSSHREIVGNLMTICYSVGLTVGSGIAYWLDDLLGPIPQNMTPFNYTCGLYNTTALMLSLERSPIAVKPI